MPVIVDCDPGIDDLVALALAVRSPEIRLAAVVTSYGNAPLAFTLRNARALLAAAGRPDVPVFAGADRPLTRLALPPRGTHGPEGAGNARLADAAVPAPDPAVLLRVLQGQRSAVTLVTTGPLTNLAAALRADGDLVRRRVARHVALAGHLGGAPVPAPDFNAWADPEALDEVLGAALGTQLVPLDVSSGVVAPPAAPGALARRGRPADQLLADALRFSMERHRAAGRDGCPVHDAAAVVAVIAPETLDFAKRRLKIGVGEGPDRGATVPADSGRAAAVATRLDAATAARLLERVFGPPSRTGPEGGT